MKWAYLSIAILLEVTGTLLMKKSNGFTQWIYGAGSLASYLCCLIFLGFALKQLPIAVAYGVWSGAGIALVSLFGLWVFKEPISLWRLLFLILVLIGCVGLQMTEMRS
jgi:small multidrug resistance pump